MRITERQRHLERLAWAGGLFDGEGSTIARGETSRPGYHRLVVAVPQLGGRTAPEVLTRFISAVRGIGKIAAPVDGIYMWRVSNDTEARATIALLKPWIGAVKRRQATRALLAVDDQYASGRIRGRPGRRLPPISVPIVKPTALGRDARIRLDRAWAAGFLDGEGCFGLARAKSRVGGEPWYRIRASVTQHGEVDVPAPVLRRLRRVLGVGRIECHGAADDFKWVAEGIPALERVLELVGPWLGVVKREQARTTMAAFARQTRLKGDRSHCKRGHDYDRVTRRRNGTLHRYCNTCARLLGRRARARMGVAPRQFKNVARRYTE